MPALSLQDPVRANPVARDDHADPAPCEAQHGLGKTLWDMLRLRCPRCRTGRMFRGSFTMNDPCPVCGLVFQREEGYFLGSMYVSFPLSTAILTPVFFTATYLLPDWDTAVLAFLSVIPYLPLMPAVFRYSRVLWTYLDRTVCPSAVSAGSYEKVRMQQAAGQELTKERSGI